MNLELVGKDVVPSEALRQRIEHKLAKIETRLGEKLVVRVSLGRNPVDYSCTVRFSAQRHEFTASANGEDLFRSADDALAKIDRQVRRSLHRSEAARRTSGPLRPPVEEEAAVRA